MTAPRLLALDLSLTGTGIAGCEGSPRQVMLRTVRSKLDGHERLQAICVNVAAACRHIAPHLVVIERLPVYTKGDTTARLAELHGLVKQQLWLNGLPYVVVDPKVLKIYATGTGGGRGDDGKQAVKSAVEARYGRLCLGYDEADALTMLGMAADHYGHPIAPSGGQPVPVPERCRRALASVNWPTLNITESPPGGAATDSPPPGAANTLQPVAGAGT